ncbi:hypothetical protein [Spirillospora sp. NPDC047279]|uniref:SCO4225 family membrane protein n=1 Tax=Spirillospora sp. NPDC047279 TaxID=3155478 RepID=UPI0033CB134C
MFRRLSAAAAVRSTGWFGIIVPAAYAALVVAAALFVVADDLFNDSGDPSFAGVWLILVTLPLSFAGLQGLEFVEARVGEVPGPFAFYAITIGCGIVQTWLLRLVTRGARRAPHPMADAHRRMG